MEAAPYLTLNFHFEYNITLSKIMKEILHGGQLGMNLQSTWPRTIIMTTTTNIILLYLRT